MTSSSRSLPASRSLYASSDPAAAMLEASPVSSALLYPIFVSRETVDYQSARVKPGRFSLFFLPLLARRCQALLANAPQSLFFSLSFAFFRSLPSFQIHIFVLSTLSIVDLREWHDESVTRIYGARLAPRAPALLLPPSSLSKRQQPARFSIIHFISVHARRIVLLGTAR